MSFFTLYSLKYRVGAGDSLAFASFLFKRTTPFATAAMTSIAVKTPTKIRSKFTSPVELAADLPWPGNSVGDDMLGSRWVPIALVWCSGKLWNLFFETSRDDALIELTVLCITALDRSESKVALAKRAVISWAVIGFNIETLSCLLSLNTDFLSGVTEGNKALETGKSIFRETAIKCFELWVFECFWFNSGVANLILCFVLSTCIELWRTEEFKKAKFETITLVLEVTSMLLEDVLAKK